jgi:hypothetical protein
MSTLFVGVDVAQATLVPTLWVERQMVDLQECSNSPDG